MSGRSRLDEITANVGGLDLWQPRDWPHRRGDDICFDLLTFPLPEDSPGRRSHACENCGHGCLCIHDNVLCWKCKRAFCLHCTATMDPNELMMSPLAAVVDEGFAKCHKCNEPLRSIGLVDVFRGGMEEMAKAEQDFHLRDFHTSNLGTGSSLVQEAEAALARGLDCFESNPEQAILEFTHAINAILASASNGDRLVLRAFDILLIAHGQRALLEDNRALFDAILAAYPKASVKRANTDEQEWRLSTSAYKTLFYPLQASLMAGSRLQGGLVLIDQRSQSREASFESPDLKKQIALAGYSTSSFLSPMFTSLHPHCDGSDPFFDSLGGIRKGLVSYAYDVPQVGGSMSFTVGGTHDVDFWGMVQFIRLFPTDLAAAEYTRIMIETKKIGEENPPLNAKESPQLTRMIKRHVNQAGVQDVQRVYAIKGDLMPAVSVVAAVANVSTKIFIQLGAGDVDGAVCYIATKAIAYLERQLKEFRATDVSSIREAPHYHPDLTVCAYCGKDDEESLRSCSRCKLSRYCTVACQKKHWEMKGQFGHAKFCKSENQGD